MTETRFPRPRRVVVKIGSSSLPCRYRTPSSLARSVICTQRSTRGPVTRNPSGVRSTHRRALSSLGGK
jgi:hypothetical protein